MRSVVGTRHARRCIYVMMCPTLVGLLAVSTPAQTERRITDRTKLKKTPADRLAEAVRILDNPEWHEDDWVVLHHQEQNARQSQDKRTLIDGYVRDRETTAIGTVIDAAMPLEQKRMLLTKYLSHHNKGVHTQALIFLINSGIWSTDEAIAYIRQNDPTSRGWNLLLGWLPDAVPAATRKEIARHVLIEAQREPRVEPSGRGSSLEGAVRVLLRTADENDVTLIRWAARQHPHAPLLWAAVSRLPHDEATTRLARKIYEDPTQTSAVRLAATLAFAKDDAAFMGEIASRIMESVREFGSLEHKAFMQKRMVNPAEPDGADRVRGAMEAEELLVVANELSDDAWRPYVEEVVRHPFSLLGSGVNAIVARRLPSDFVGAIATLESIPDELDGPISVALSRAPVLGEKIGGFLPPSRFQKLRQPEPQELAVVSLLRRVTLWD
jgi:hypothetical protein